MLHPFLSLENKLSRCAKSGVFASLGKTSRKGKGKSYLLGAISIILLKGLSNASNRALLVKNYHSSLLAVKFLAGILIIINKYPNQFHCSCMTDIVPD